MNDGLTWSSILSLSLTTGLATALLNQGVGIVRERMQERKNDRRSGHVAALRIIEILTAFASECGQYADWNQYDKDQGEYGRYMKLPTLEPYPDAGWDVLPGDIAIKLRDLRNEVHVSNENIRVNDEINSPPDAYDSATRLCIVLGMSAWNLSNRLRANYDLAKYESSIALSSLQRIEELHKELMKRDHN